MPPGKQTLHRWLRLCLKIAGVFIVLLIVAVLGISIYVTTHKQQIITSITGVLNDKINGQLVMGKVDVELLKGFPGISVSLTNVSLRDTSWHVHRHDLLQAKEMHITANLFSLIEGSPTIRNISIKDGTIYLFTNEQGISNRHILKQKEDTQSQNPPSIKYIAMENVRFVFENKSKFKFFNIHIAKLASAIDHNSSGWVAKSNISAMINDFTFNTNNGSFLKNKALNSSMKLSYNSGNKILTIPAQSITIDKDKLDISGNFAFGRHPSTFSLNIGAKSILYKNALALVSPNIFNKMKKIDMEKPISLQGSVKGRIMYKDTPVVRIAWNVQHNTLITPSGNVEDCSMEGEFLNEVVVGAGHNDPNSRISLKYIKASWQDIPFESKNVQITNLLTPAVSGVLASHFLLEKLNIIVNSSSIKFQKGNADVNVNYRFTVSDGDIASPFLQGSVDINDADINYVPRQLLFTNSALSLYMDGHDLYVKQAKLNKGSTTLVMKGSVKKLLTLFYTEPDKVILDWQVQSALVNIGDFQSFIGKRKKIKNEIAGGVTHNRAERIAAQLDKVLDQSNVHMTVKVDKLVYKNFTGSDINAEITLVQTGILLQNVRISQAGGILKLNASIEQGELINDFKVQANVEHINVRDFFSSFENFGQDAITDNNIRGILNADIKMTGRMYDDAKIVPASFDGTVYFKLKDGALLNFRPFEKIGKFVFRRRDMSNITFGNLENTLVIKANKVTISPMHIESSALSMNIQGVYAFDTGTNVNIDVSMRNPKKDELVEDANLKIERSMKGINLHFNAVDGDDSSVRIKWSLRDKKTK